MGTLLQEQTNQPKEEYGHQNKNDRNRSQRNRLFKPICRQRTKKTRQLTADRPHEKMVRLRTQNVGPDHDRF